MTAMGRAALGVALTLVVSCGSRTRIDVSAEQDDPFGGPAGSTGSGGAGAAGGDGGGGEGGTPPEVGCDFLSWAGEPLYVSAGTLPSVSPRLIRTSANSYAVVFEADTSGPKGRTLFSFALDDPFGTWPPTPSDVQPHFPSTERFAVGRGEPGTFGFVAAGPGVGSLVLGNAVAGENGSTFIEPPLGVTQPRIMERSGLGKYLVGSGAPSLLNLAVVSGFDPSASVTSLGTLGCAMPESHASAAPFTNADAWWVASSVDTPFDDCLDPDIPGPALYAQVHRVAPDGVTPGGFVKPDTGVLELDVTATDDGGWLGVQGVGTNRYVIRSIDSSGALGEMATYVMETDLVAAQYAIAGFGRGAAVAQLISANEQPGGELNLAVFNSAGDGAQIGGFEFGVFPIGVPDVATSEANASVLVVFEAQANATAQLVLMRADCGQTSR